MHRLEPYLPRLYRYAFSLTREEELAKDLVQQCALKSLAAKSVPDEEAAYRAWLFIILRNAFRDHLRRNRLKDALFQPDPLPEDEPVMEYWRGDERLINILNVKQAMGRLNAKDREIIGLVDLAGLSYAESAEVLDIPAGTVMSRISRARARLLALIGESNVAPLKPARARRRT
ncbi:MAG: sigma-70 family RNA polymerase sigma factor [Alphaproteobacteria bacterium]|nr:sigma-70 family RNA polymerase sigma factor [Alphaproteobacteria bacterium]